jgi:hypothetical protein
METKRETPKYHEYCKTVGERAVNNGSKYAYSINLGKIINPKSPNRPVYASLPVGGSGGMLCVILV